MPPENSTVQSNRAAVLGSDESFRFLVECVEDCGIILLDAQGKVASWNPGAERLSGYRREEVLGENVSVFYPREAREQELLEKELRTASQAGRFEGEGWRVRKDGTRFWAGVVISALRDANGAIIGFAKLMRDLTARKEAEEEVRRLKAELDRSAREHSAELSCGNEAPKTSTGAGRAEREMDRFFEMSLDMICVAGLDGYFRKLNPAWERTLGFTEQELRARPFIEFIHPDDRAATLEQIKKMDEGADVIHFENRYRHKDGSYRWFAWKAPAISPGQDYLYATARDVTDRRQDQARIANLLQRLDLATHAAHLGIWDWDIVRNELVWDERMYELYGVRKEDFGGAYDAWLKGVHPDDRAHCDEAIRKALSGEKEYDIDFRVRRPDRYLRVIKANGHVVRDAAGKPIRMTGINYDITDVKRAAQRVALQLAVSRVLTESSTLEQATPRVVEAIAQAVSARVGAIWGIDPKSNVLRCINVWREPGFDAADFERTTRKITFAPGIGIPGRVWQTRAPVWIPDLAADPNFPRAAVASTANLHAAFGAPILSGRTCLGAIEFFSSEIHQPDTELLDVCSGIGSQVGQFIERKLAEAELREREARMRAVLDNAIEGIITIDERGIIESANRAAEKMFGYPLAEMIGRNASLLMPDPSTGELDRHLSGYIRTGSATMIGAGRDVVGRRKDGSVFPMDLAASEIQIDGRRIFTGFVRDITERKRAEEKLSLLSAEAVHRAAQLEAANKELEAFSYSVSHDLRAPLRHVQGYVELLKKAAGDQLPEKARRHLEVISDAGRQMGQLIDDLLAFSRIGRAEMQRVIVDLDELVQHSLHALELETRDRRINWKIAPLPQVMGDRGMLRQVFANLMGNAVKYTGPRDPAVIEIGCAGRNKGFVTIFIKDNGVGFDMQYADKLFGVFQRLHTAEEFEGTGIGLANVRRIIDRHGGRIWPEAAVGKGATLSFTLEEAASPPQTQPQA